MTDVFLSYSHEDREFAEKLVRALQANTPYRKLSIWWDEDVDANGKALQLANLMIVLLSDDTLKNDRVQREFNYFLQQNKLIVPMLIGSIDYASLPHWLRRLQFVDARDNQQQALDNLVTQVTHLLENPGDYQRTKPAKRHVTMTFDVHPDENLADIIARISHLDGNTHVDIQDNMGKSGSETVQEPDVL